MYFRFCWHYEVFSFPLKDSPARISYMAPREAGTGQPSMVKLGPRLAGLFQGRSLAPLVSLQCNCGITTVLVAEAFPRSDHS